MFPMITYSANYFESKSSINNDIDTDELERLNELRNEFRAPTPSPTTTITSTSPVITYQPYQYTRLTNYHSPSIDSKVDTEIIKTSATSINYQQETPVAKIEVKSTKKQKQFSDQKLPKEQKNQQSPAQSVKSFVYINKNGYTQIIKANINEDKELNKLNILSTSHEININNNSVVPMNILNNSLSSSNSTGTSSIIQTNENGQIQINTNAMIDEEYIDIKYDHVKYLALISILCCWCFPFTGLPAVVYSILMKKYYSLHDMLRAKQYLIKAEKLVLLTFFFGFTLISILFALLQIYYFNKNINDSNNSTNEYRMPSYRPFIPH